MRPNALTPFLLLVWIYLNNIITDRSFAFHGFFQEQHAEAQSTDRREGKERDGASGLLEAILDRDNLNRAYKRVKRNRGAAGIDGMTVEEALPWLKERRGELLQSIRDGSYVPSPVWRKEIPKPDGGVRKLGIPTVVDRVIQQAIAQKLQSIWEPLFSDSSYGAGSECTSGSSGRSPKRRWLI